MQIDPTKTHPTLEHKHDRPLVACRFDPTGRFVFFGAEDNLVHRFDLKSKTVTPLAAHESWVRALGCSPCTPANRLAEGGSGLARPEGGCGSAQPNHGPSDVILYTGGYDGRLIFWPAAAEKPEPIRVIQAHDGWLRALAVSPAGYNIATCGNDNCVKLWNAADGALLHTFSGHESHVYNVAFRPTGQSLVSCDLKGNIKEWDLATGSLQRDLTPAAALYKYDTTFRADIGGARSIAFRADGEQLAVGGITNVTNAFAGIGHAAVVLLDMAAGKLALQLEAKEKVNGVAWGLAHHPGVAGGERNLGVAGGERSSTPAAGFWIGLTGGGGGGWLYFWKGDPNPVGNALRGVPNADKDNAAKETLNEFHKLKLASDGRDLALSPDKTQLVVAHFDKTLRIYSLRDKPV